MARRKRDPKKDALVQAILNQYQPENVGEMQDARKDIFGPMFEAMLQGEIENHLGYESNDWQEKEGTNHRNGYSHKTLKTSFGDVPIEAPRDREASFAPKIIPKRTTNVSGIEDKVLSMYAKGMS
jgi:putative transposase